MTLMTTGLYTCTQLDSNEASPLPRMTPNDTLYHTFFPDVKPLTVSRRHVKNECGQTSRWTGDRARNYGLGLYTNDGEQQEQQQQEQQQRQQQHVPSGLFQPPNLNILPHFPEFSPQLACIFQVLLKIYEWIFNKRIA